MLTFSDDQIHLITLCVATREKHLAFSVVIGVDLIFSKRQNVGNWTDFNNNSNIMCLINVCVLCWAKYQPWIKNLWFFFSPKIPVSLASFLALWVFSGQLKTSKCSTFHLYKRKLLIMQINPFSPNNPSYLMCSWEKSRMLPSCCSALIQWIFFCFYSFSWRKRPTRSAPFQAL